jgi:Domain of unknown function (DUF5664)
LDSKIWKENPDDPVVTNDQGGSQSEPKFDWLAFPFDTFMTLVENGVADPLVDVAEVLEEGSKKYGLLNWQKIEEDDHLNHVVHHAIAATRFIDSEDRRIHLTHAICRALFALYVGERREESQGKGAPVSAPTINHSIQF